MNPIILAILMGLIAGICRSILGYFKNSEEEVFIWAKLLKTVVITGICGAIIGLFTPDWKLAFALSFTGGVVVNDLINAHLNKK